MTNELQIIEKLKDKDYVRAFGLMKPEEREVFCKIGKNNCLRYVSKHEWTQPLGDDFLPDVTYAIKPDYQPEPEYVDLEIKDIGGILGVDKDERVEWPKAIYFSCILSYLPSLPNFEGFHIDSEMCMNITEIANYMAWGKKVCARMRTKQELRQLAEQSNG